MLSDLLIEFLGRLVWLVTCRLGRFGRSWWYKRGRWVDWRALVRKPDFNWLMRGSGIASILCLAFGAIGAALEIVSQLS